MGLSDQRGLDEIEARLRVQPPSVRGVRETAKDQTRRHDPLDVFWPAEDPVVQVTRFAEEVAPAAREALS
jgi:hypothetical protein